MKTRLAAAGIAVVLAATVVSGAASPPRAHATTTPAVSCGNQKLPLSKGRAVRVAASLAGETATLRGTSGSAYAGTPRVLHPRLTLTSAAHDSTAFEVKPVPQTPGRGVLVDGIDAPGSGAPALCLAQFADGPVALLGVTSAFNQCCFLLDTYAAGTRARSALQDGLVMPRLRVLDGQPAIVSADGNFLARFTDYADSPAPLRVLTVRSGQQRDVTDAHTSMLRREATRWWAAFEHQPSHGLGYVAAWAADEDRLGNDAAVWPKLRELDDAGKLDGMSGWPRGQAFIHALRSFLTNHGYRG